MPKEAKQQLTEQRLGQRNIYSTIFWHLLGIFAKCIQSQGVSDTLRHELLELCMMPLCGALTLRKLKFETPVGSS